MNQNEKDFENMTTNELRRATARFNKELPASADGLPGRPLNAAEKRNWRTLKRKMGRPRMGKGVKRVMISVEAGLLKQADLFAREHHLKRSEMISEGLRRLMAG